MSRDEAIRILKNFSLCGVYHQLIHMNDTDSEAISMAIKALEQPEPIRINLNEPIKVKPKFPKEDENGYTEFQLWCFMELYGEHMGMTLPNVIEPLEIVYER